MDINIHELGLNDAAKEFMKYQTQAVVDTINETCEEEFNEESKRSEVIFVDGKIGIFFEWPHEVNITLFQPIAEALKNDFGWELSIKPCSVKIPVLGWNPKV